MAYNQFTLPKVIADFGLTVESVRDLFPGVRPVPVPAWLVERYSDTAVLATTEAARAHFLIAPLLEVVWRAGKDSLALYAGARFDVDETRGLTGVCDFAVTLPPQLYYITAPVLLITEAKNEDMTGGLGQCAAELVAAREFNAGKPAPSPVVYGCVSDGDRWRFLRIDGDHLTLESSDRHLYDTDRLFGILLHCVGLNPVPA